MGVDVEPLVEARPAEEVAAEGDDGVLRELEADVALEAGGVGGGAGGFAVLTGHRDVRVFTWIGAGRERRWRFGDDGRC